MNKYMAIYMMPSEGLKEWMKKEPAERAAEEASLKAKWDEWMVAHSEVLAGPTAGLGKNKRVTVAGAEDAANDLMMYSMVTAESSEAAAEIFVAHPHLEIPGAWIDVMQANELPGMK